MITLIFLCQLTYHGMISDKVIYRDETNQRILVPFEELDHEEKVKITNRIRNHKPTIRYREKREIDQKYKTMLRLYRRQQTINKFNRSIMEARYSSFVNTPIGQARIMSELYNPRIYYYPVRIYYSPSYRK